MTIRFFFFKYLERVIEETEILIRAIMVLWGVFKPFIGDSCLILSLKSANASSFLHFVMCLLCNRSKNNLLHSQILFVHGHNICATTVGKKHFFHELGFFLFKWKNI